MKTESIPLQEAAGFGVVVLGASAGGQAAVVSILRDLPLDFDVPIVVVQHLPPDSGILGVYGGRLPFTFEWIDESSRLATRKVLVCPSRVCAELLPDGTFRLEPTENGALDKQIDRMLRSVARSFSHRAIGVVLSGMGNDGAAGARELHEAGGRVLVQSEGSADFPEMPRNAVKAGAADLVVPLRDLAQVLGEFVAGGARPQSRSELDAIESVFGSTGEIAALAREIDWSRTPIGAALQWPVELRLIASTAIESPHPSAVWWGREFVLLYNEAYRRFLGVTKHPDALGRPAREVWGEVWDDVGPMVDRVMRSGVVVHETDYRFVIDRHRFVEEIFANFAFSPIRDARGTVVGVYNTCLESTQKVVAERRMTALRALGAQIAGASTQRQVGEQAAAALASDPLDLPFALVYLFDADRRQATLAGAAGVAPGSAVAPHTMALTGAQDTWAMQRLIESTATLESSEALLEDLERRVPELASLFGGNSGRSVPHSAVVVPLRSAEDRLPIGALVAGLNPQRPFDDDCRNFVALVAQQVSAGLTAARAWQLERERRDRLAELDRAKTEFFANVSHEFRTPLTLLLSPLEEMRRRRDELPGDLANEIDLAARNSRRLLRLVDSLLDFSQIEQRRQRVSLQPTDLATLTTDVASAFRSAIERAGLVLHVQCEGSLPLVPVDREMWEKIVSNLLSNALKFTFEGEIAVRLRALSLHVELSVYDTGIGIPKDELPNVFKRFHRVRGARARTIEGSGIGLALVHDLVSRMGGQLQVHSTEGRGTTFTIWMPLKSHRKTFDAGAAAEAGARAPRIAAGLAEEAQTWVDPRATALGLDDALGAPDGERLRLAPGARVLVADDNADLRDYLQRLLGANWNVSTVADGAEALRAARSQRPDLILADVMMPNVDGFALLRAVRDDEALKDTPVVFLTARAGEDTAIRGLLAGADDYLAKPFSARELIARVGGQIELSRARRRTQELNEFLVRFSDAVRGLTDPRAVGDTACRMLLEQLGVDRAHWGEIDWTTEEFVIIGSVHAPGVAPLKGRFPLAAWELYSASHRQGRAMVVEDTQADPRADSAMREATARMGIGADVAAPVLTGGRLTCVLGVNQRLPRRWTSQEIALVQSVAGRCWSEVERARAELRLREREAKFRAVFETMIEACCIFDMIYDDLGKPVDWRILEANPGYEKQSGLKDVAGKLASEVMPGTESYWHETFGRVADTGEPEQIEKWHEPTDRWVHSSTARVGGSESRRLVSVFYDITERKRAEIALRESEERQAFLLKLSDTLRPLADPLAVIATASELVGRYLDAGRCGYGELPPPHDEFVVERDWTNGMPSHRGRWRLADFGDELVAQNRAGSTLVIDDALADERSEGARDALQAAGGLRASIGVPLIKDGNWIAAFFVHDSKPRRWTKADVELVEEVAERTWTAIERARAELAVKRSEERLRSVADSGVVAIAFFDATGAITDASDAFLGMVGYSRAELEAGDVRWDRLTPLEWMAQTRRAVEQYQTTGSIEPYEKEYFRRNGERFWGLFSGCRLEATGEGVAVVLDITERKRAEEALRASDERLRRVLDGMGEGFGLLAPDFTILEHNREALRMDGRPREEIVGRSHWEAFPGSETSEVGRLLKKAMAERVPLSLEHRYAWKEGRALWLDMRAYPTSDGSLAVFWRDVTKRREAQDALRESEAHLATELEDAQALQKLSNELVSEGGPDGLYNHIVEVTRTLMRSDAASIQELDARGSRLQLLAHTGFHPESAAYWAVVDAEVGTSCGRALAARKRVVVPDMDEFEADPDDIAAYGKSGIMSVQSTPLVASSGRIVGMMSTHWDHPHTPSADSYRFFDVLARLAADFIERARIQTVLRESEERYRTLFETRMRAT